MKTIAVTRTEGSSWIEFKEWDLEPNRPDYEGTGLTVHSILFDDGSVWDAVQGFRGNKLDLNEVKVMPAGTTRDVARDVVSRIIPPPEATLLRSVLELEKPAGHV